LFAVAGHLVNGLTTVIVPVEFRVMDVGPVKRHPVPPCVWSASARMPAFDGGIVNGAAYFGSPGWNVGLEPEQLPPLQKYRGELVFQLVVTAPLNTGSPEIPIASFVCSGPLIVS
jgi:hypothetical protein